jgi:hypothetical protein
MKKHHFDAFRHEKHFEKQLQPHFQTCPILSQYILNSLEIEFMILSLNIKLFNYTPCVVVSKQETNSDFMVVVTVKVYLAFF